MFVLHSQIFKTESLCSQKAVEYFLQNVFNKFLRVSFNFWEYLEIIFPKYFYRTIPTHTGIYKPFLTSSQSMGVKYRLKCVLLFFILNQWIFHWTTLKTVYQAAFRVHIEDMLYKSWPYANKISYFFSHAVVRQQQCCLWGWAEEKKTPFIELQQNLNLRKHFSFLVSSQSNGLSHTTVDENPHLKFDSLMVLEAALSHPPAPVSCVRRGHRVLVLASSPWQHGKQPVILLWMGGGSWENVTVSLYFHLSCSSRSLAEFACTAYGF